MKLWNKINEPALLWAVFAFGRAGSPVPRRIVGYLEETQQQWLGEITLTACASFEFVLLDVSSQTSIITELSDSSSFSPSFFGDKDGIMHNDVTPTVCTGFAHML